MLKNITLFIISTTVFCITLEVISRIWLNDIATPEQFRQYVLHTEVPPLFPQYIGHPYLNYFPNPEYSREWSTGTHTHNSLGYRDKEFSINKPEGIFRIVAIGGSTTNTIAVHDNEKTYPSYLNRILKADYGYANVEVINAGVGGYTTWESLINLEYRILDLEPDSK